MATRIHVTALRNTTPAAVRAAYPEPANLKINEYGGWCWFTASVWSVGAAKILEKLEGLGGPIVLATTEDDCRWYLHLRRQGQTPFVTMHDFTQCRAPRADYDHDDLYEFDEGDFACGVQEITVGPPPIPASSLPPLALDDAFFAPYVGEEEEGDVAVEEDAFDDSPLGRLQENYDLLGVGLREKIVAQLQGLPEEEVRIRFLEIHAEDIVRALDDFGVPHDRRRVIDTLIGASVTDAELDSGIGNLPRFLAALGLGPEMERAVAEAEDTQRTWDNQEPPDFSRDVLTGFKPPELEQWRDAPFDVPVEEAPLLFRAGYFVHEDTLGAFEATLPHPGEFRPSEPMPTYLSVRQDDTSLHLGASSMDAFLMPKSVAKIGALLAALPNGSYLTLRLRSGTSGNQLYAGSITSGRWHVERASGYVPAAALRRAMELFRTVHAGATLRAESELEVRRILEAAKGDLTFCDTPPGLDGLAFDVRRRHRNDLARLLFRERFGQVWNCAPAIEQDRERAADWLASQEELARAERLPATDGVLLDGRASRFLELDPAAASEDEEFENNFPKMPKYIAAFEALGFRHVGDFVCERVGKAIICAFVSEAEQAFGAHYLLPWGATWQDCFTHFEDGTDLTTTSGPSEGSIRSLRILHHKAHVRHPKKLLEAHRKGLEILRNHGIEKVTLEPTLDGILRAMDDFLVKRLPADHG